MSQVNRNILNYPHTTIGNENMGSFQGLVIPLGIFYADKGGKRTSSQDNYYIFGSIPSDELHKLKLGNGLLRPIQNMYTNAGVETDWLNPNFSPTMPNVWLTYYSCGSYFPDYCISSNNNYTKISNLAIDNIVSYDPFGEDPLGFWTDK